MNQSTDSTGDVMGVVDKAREWADSVIAIGGAWNDRATCNAARVILALIERTQWRPIASAPRDGAAIILWRERKTPWVGRWISDDSGFTKCWNTAPERDATHWKPLDLPPAAVGQNAQGDGG